MQLGFLEFEVSKLATWRGFMTEVLGLAAAGDDRFRLDSHAWRFQLREGPADDLNAVGWEFTPDELEAAIARLRAAGVPVAEADPAARSASQRFTCRDPAGVPTELVTGLSAADQPFTSPHVLSGFLADSRGLGHLVLTSKDKAASTQFYTDYLGFRLSDHIVCEMYGHAVDLSFFHANARHHSVAFGGPQPKKIHHFMVEARSMDEVGKCYDRAIRSGARIMHTLGRHPNDQMFSFYAKTPSGFQFEFGWGGREIDDAHWEPTTYDRVSDWGHHPPQVVFRRPQ